MFQFPALALMPYRFRQQSFGDPGINACLTARPGLSQPSTPFIAFRRQDIPRVPFLSLTTRIRDSRPHACASRRAAARGFPQKISGKLRPPGRSCGGDRSLGAVTPGLARRVIQKMPLGHLSSCQRAAAGTPPASVRATRNRRPAEAAFVSDRVSRGFRVAGRRRSPAGRERYGRRFRRSTPRAEDSPKKFRVLPSGGPAPLPGGRADGDEGDRTPDLLLAKQR